VSSLQLSLDEPLSPELALVCPELAEQARRILPDPGCLAPVAQREVTVRIRPLHIAVLALISILVTATPLALLLLVGSSTLR
jgi:hypothetical protein